MTYQNPRGSAPRTPTAPATRPSPPNKQNPGQATPPSYAPRAGQSTPAPSGGSRGGSGGGQQSQQSGGQSSKGRGPDWRVFFAEVTTDQSGKRNTRVLTQVDPQTGKEVWMEAAALWMPDREGGLPLLKVTADIPAGAVLALREPGGRRS